MGAGDDARGRWLVSYAPAGRSVAPSGWAGHDWSTRPAVGCSPEPTDPHWMTPMARNDTATFHSFRRLLDTHQQSYEDYVLSDSRHTGLIRFLDRQLAQCPSGTALDIGCGAGSVSRGLATRYGSVIGIDQNSDNVALAAQLTDKSGKGNVRYQTGAAAALPLEDQSVDLALLNGVLEWVGLNDAGEKPQARQRQVLREVLRVLKPGGHLYLAIENRTHPRTLLRDPHTHLPLVNALPRSLASIISWVKTGKPFQAYIYGHTRLQGLLAETGFGSSSVYVAFPGYQHPSDYIPICPKEAALAAIDEIDISIVEALSRERGQAMDAGRAVARLRRHAGWGLLGVLAHDFALLAVKPDDASGAN